MLNLYFGFFLLRCLGRLFLGFDCGDNLWGLLLANVGLLLTTLFLGLYSPGLWRCQTWTYWVAMIGYGLDIGWAILSVVLKGDFPIVKTLISMLIVAYLLLPNVRRAFGIMQYPF